MSSDATSIVHEWFEQVWNQGSEDAIDRLFATDGVVHGLVDEHGNAVRGPSSFKPFYRRFRQAFPDIRISVEDAISDGDRCAVRCLVTGTHLGDDLGIQATRNPIRFAGMAFVRVRDGQIAEAWNLFDFSTMNTQITTVSNRGDDERESV